MSKVNLKEVAAKAGVSMMSVSRAINNKPGLNQKTRDKIMAIVREMGYVPNQLAGNLGRKGTQTIGVVLPIIEHTNFPDMLRGIEAVLSAEHYKLILTCSYNDVEKEQEKIEALLKTQVDGIIWVPATLEDQANNSQLIRQQGRKLVFMDRLIPSIEADAVIVDDYQGAYNAIEHLNRQGYQKIAHVTDCVPAWTSQERLRGYQDAIKDFKQKEYILETSASVEGGVDVIERILELPKEERPDALFAFNDPIAIGIGKVLWKEKISPQEMGLVGYANTLASEICAVPLSTVHQNSEAIGRQAALSILHLIREPDLDLGTSRHSIKTQLIERESSQRS